jgi:hypothetical protein
MLLIELVDFLAAVIARDEAISNGQHGLSEKP